HARRAFRGAERVNRHVGIVQSATSTRISHGCPNSRANRGGASQLMSVSRIDWMDDCVEATTVGSVATSVVGRPSERRRVVGVVASGVGRPNQPTSGPGGAFLRAFGRGATELACDSGV